MRQFDYDKIENTFRYSNSSNELFDAFQTAMENGIKDADLFKVLIGNPVLSNDELKMYTEKLAATYPELGYDMFMWAARIFENKVTDYDCIVDSFEYYQKAAEYKPKDCEPFIKLINLYNTDMDLPVNRAIISAVDDCIPRLNKKSKVYYSMAELYKQLGEQDKAKEYMELAEKAALREKK